MQKIPPPTEGGTFDLGFEKTLIFADYYGRNEKSAAGENFRNRDYFYTKNSAKMQKNGQQKIHPPPLGGQKMYLIWESPGRGITENPPTAGNLPPPTSLNF